jgi:hypothetical protein
MSAIIALSSVVGVEFAIALEIQIALHIADREKVPDLRADAGDARLEVENWRRGYEAALSGLAYMWAGYEKTSAWRLGYRDGRALRLKQHAEARHLDIWPMGGH